MTARFQLGPIYAGRPTGVPFDVLEQVSTPGVAEQAKRLLAARAAFEAATQSAMAAFKNGFTGERKTRERVWKKLTQHQELPPGVVAANAFLADTDAAGAAYRGLLQATDELIESEYKRIHTELVRHGSREIPDFLVFESESFATELERLETLLDDGEEVRRRDRRKDRTIALYLQRVCSKNDTISRFGPSVWGTVVSGSGVTMRPTPGIAQRRAELERWVIKGIVDLMNQDPDVRAEVAPRVHAFGRFEGNAFLRLDEDRLVELTAAERALVERCDGRTPAHALGNAEMLDKLAAAGVLVWELELMARDTSFMTSLMQDIEGWRPGDVRDRWLPRLRPLVELARAFAADTTADGRRAIVRDVLARFESLGGKARATSRALYAAKNPINENCYQTGTFTLGAGAVEKMLVDAAPWFSLFEDCSRLAVQETFNRMKAVIAAAPRRHGRLDYLSFIRTGNTMGVRLADDGLTESVASELFVGVKRAFAEQLSTRPDAHECELTDDDCSFIRRAHALPPSGELSLPSADLQVAADSVEDAAAGRVRWVISELHHAFVNLQHALYWSCPDKAALGKVLGAVIEQTSWTLREAGAFAPVHGQGEAALHALPRCVYVGSHRPKPSWPYIKPADVEVVLDEARVDVRLRHIATGEDLGTIVRLPRLMTGMHPFFPFERAPHAPRLRMGNVVVQRETWHVDSDDLVPDRPEGVSGTFVAAIERLRADRGIPRHVFVRPARSLVGENSFARDKDDKPMYVDLESVVFLDILERRMRKFKTMKVTEMLPTPDELIWRSPEGRFTFELRTNILRAGSL